MLPWANTAQQTTISGLFLKVTRALARLIFSSYLGEFMTTEGRRMWLELAHNKFPKTIALQNSYRAKLSLLISYSMKRNELLYSTRKVFLFKTVT